MARHVTLTLSIRDLASMKLLLLRLTLLRDKLRVEANPAAAELDAILETWARPMSDGGPDDGAGGGRRDLPDA